MIMHGNPAFIDAFGAQVVGQPAREALIGLPPKAFELMDLVFSTGKPGACRVTTAGRSAPAGRRPAARPGDRRDYGVTTHLRPVDD